MEKNELPWLTRPGTGVAYSILAPGPHGPGYRLAGSPVSCRKLEADAGTIIFWWGLRTVHKKKQSLWRCM